MTARILTVTSAFPAYAMELDDAIAHAQTVSCENDDQARKLAKIYQRTGVETRGSVLIHQREDATLTQTFYEPLAPDNRRGPSMRLRNERFAAEAPAIGTAAASDAFQSSGVTAGDITHLITISCTGFTAPGLDVALIKSLGLSRWTERIAVGFMGCHGLINGLRAARGVVAAQPDARVLIVSVELCSLHYQYGYDAQRIVSGAIFADGAAAAIVAGASGQDETGAEQNEIGTIAATGSRLIDDSEEAMTWRIGDHGFLMTLEATVPMLIERELDATLTQWLSRYGETIGSIGGWAVHPGGSRILQAVQAALTLPDGSLDASYQVLRDHGNMSSATLGAVLGLMADRKIPKPWVMLGFGPGLEIELALLR